jgi:thioredoxin reductase (NADPH)
MSEYLVHRIASSHKISLHTFSEIVALEGEKSLTGVDCANRVTGERKHLDVHHVFVMIGADPSTEWLGGCVELDKKGFIKTGFKHDIEEAGLYRTSKAGIFAVGDVRSGSVKRVASGVGEGSVVVADLHTFLKDVPAVR